jgi:ABC-type phosphate/phosphonate transport system permease subunit
MTISLTPEKVTHFLESEDKFRKGVHITIRKVAKFVGTLIAYSVAIPLGLLYTRILEREKNRCIKIK